MADSGSRFLVIDGMRVRYKRAGRGRPVLLLHGSGSSLDTFDLIARRLSTRNDVLRLDLPGFGLTGPRPDRDYRITTTTGTVRRILEALKIPPAVVGGTSLGGNIAWNLALDAPDAVSGLVLINATGYPGKKPPLPMRLARSPIGRALIRLSAGRAGVERSLRSSVGPGSQGAVTSELIDRVHAMMTRPGNMQAFIDFARTDQEDRSALVRRITTPTLVLRSEGMDGQHFTHDLPHAVERVRPAGGHLLTDEDPQWVADAIEAFLDTLDDREKP
ncbi:MAG TPA: alpha/beta hydrolase [Microbacterium sp.]|uniref:alpha/beta fold hydrolase n=1 Tax=Microbacterium sp. TaxID=51671 RepID=UPI002CE6C387|nr:alpha/beta hydrolase [Microbacterium sp.]HWI31460.1 alpha/beta hydrolase [Microbacterium sp.]